MIHDTIPQELVSLTQSPVIAIDVDRMFREQTHCHSVEECPPPVSGFGPDAIHQGGEPEDSEPVSELELARRLAVDRQLSGWLVRKAGIDNGEGLITLKFKNGPPASLFCRLPGERVIFGIPQPPAW